MFDEVRQAFRELLHGNVSPEGRRELISVMKDTLVQARLAMDDLREGVEATRKRVTREQLELETIRRRKGLAQGVGDAETVVVAERLPRIRAALNDVSDRFLFPGRESPDRLLRTVTADVRWRFAS